MESRPRWRTVLDVVTSLVLVAGAASVLWSTVGRPLRSPSVRSEVEPPAELQSLNGVAIRGETGAPVAVIAYSDFQCPYCGRFARETLPELDRRYIRPGKVLFAFRHFPLERIHPLAIKAAEMAECAGRHGKFWEMHDALFSASVQFHAEGLVHAATLAGLSRVDAQACLAQDATEKVRADLALAEALKLTGTPAFLIGTLESGGVRVVKVLKGARPISDFSTVIEALLR